VIAPRFRTVFIKAQQNALKMDVQFVDYKQYRAWNVSNLTSSKVNIKLLVEGIDAFASWFWSSYEKLQSSIRGLFAGCISFFLCPDTAINR
jgi:hypothetical protein